VTDAAASPAPVHVPDPALAERAQIVDFAAACARRAGRDTIPVDALHAFSIEHRDTFWATLVDWADLIVEGDAAPVWEGQDPETGRFFPNLRLSYAENLLTGEDAHPAIVALDETGRRVALTRGALRARARAAMAGFRALGVEPGVRVVAVACNDERSVIAALAVTALGGIWSAAAPDMGIETVIDRFEPLEPTLLLAHTARSMQGRPADLRPLIGALAARLPTLRGVVALDDGDPALDPALELPVHALGAFEADPDDDGRWPRFAFDHPLFILFSSGTTGRPKCIVHGAGGTLLEHIKEHRLHGDLRPEDRLFFQTSCGWMMWNWAVSALACGATILVYDGSVSHPSADALLRHVAAERVTCFGTSPPYLQYCEASGMEPGRDLDLGALRSVLSTGSILQPHQFEWVRDHLRDVPVQSISGGTDIVGCFVLGHPTRPVWAGECQSISLGIDVRAKGEDGVLRRTGHGELVVVGPFPSRPVGLYGDADGTRFHAAYYAETEGAWTHGDFVELSERGTARILGRSDGVMNIRGVRIGPAEIYQALAGFSEVEAAMAVEQRDPRTVGGSRVVLFVRMAADATLDRPLTLRMKKAIKARGSANHVPGLIVAVDALPETYSGKRSERAVSDFVNGRALRNRNALRNPEALDHLLERLRAAEPRRG
jgi:acetoacetyl-CoA synthetase